MFKLTVIFPELVFKVKIKFVYPDRMGKGGGII
jgi:hypothetical protein